MPDELESPQYSLFEVEEPSPVQEARSAHSKFSDFIVYVDESDDHGMGNLDANYPMFVLAFCVFYKRNYAERVVPALEKFKCNHFGHDLVVLHEHEIRKETGSFRFENRQTKQDFIAELTSIIEVSNFILISCVINKDALKRTGDLPSNPYNLALGFCLDALYELMEEKRQGARKTHVVFERRGEREDQELELEFRRICDGHNRKNTSLPFSIICGAPNRAQRPASLTAEPRLRDSQDQVLLRRRAKEHWRWVRGQGLEDLPGSRKRKAPMNLTEA